MMNGREIECLINEKAAVVKNKFKKIVQFENRKYSTKMGAVVRDGEIFIGAR